MKLLLEKIDEHTEIKGWIQLYSENNQEANDNMLMAHRIAEHPM